MREVDEQGVEVMHTEILPQAGSPRVKLPNDVEFDSTVPPMILQYSGCH